MAEIEDIKKFIANDKAIIGTDKVLKELKNGNIEKVFMTSNVPDDVKETIQHYSKISEVDVVRLKLPNDELGTLCKKPFSISVLGIIK